MNFLRPPLGAAAALGPRAIIIACLLSSTLCHAFAPVSVSRAACLAAPPAAAASIHPPQQRRRFRCANDHHGRSRISTYLQVVTKRQTFILDGAELSYYIQSMATDEARTVDEALPDLAPRAPRKRNRVGAITFVACSVADEDSFADSSILSSDGPLSRIEEGAQIVGVEVPSKDATAEEAEADDSRGIVSMDKGLRLYEDSIAILPSNVSPADAISTAAASLLGVHCTASARLRRKAKKEEEKGKILVVGGGEHAAFLSTALSGLGNEVALVTARPPWSLPSLPSDVEVLPPAVGAMSLGFATAIGEFDALIDTLGDEAGAGNARSVVDKNDEASDLMEQLRELHGCDQYLSTVTRSQRYVLKEGLLFARDKVIRYQKEVESFKNSEGYQILPPPPGFGCTLQQLLDQDITYPCDRNENGGHETKSNFVRGWSLSDLTELKTWPREGPRRFGFPAVDLSVSSVILRRKALKRKEDTSRIETVQPKALRETMANQTSTSVDNNNEERENGEHSKTQVAMTASKSDATITITNRPPKSTRVTSNPHVTTILSASELNRKIVERKRNCILFLTASYCQKCKRMAPQFNRMARVSTSAEATSDNSVLFARADISDGPRGKQLGEILGVEKVPSVIVFRRGDRMGAGGTSPSTVVERSNLNRLGEVAKLLERDERNVCVEALLSPETVEK